jgi:outer membrane protein assembly factor BamB
MSQVSYDGQHLFVGGERGNISGVICAGTFRELNPATGGNIWKGCLTSGPVLGAVTGVPGVAFVGAGKTFYAVNMTTGATLWTFQDTNSGSNF